MQSRVSESISRVGESVELITRLSKAGIELEWMSLKFDCTGVSETRVGFSPQKPAPFQPANLIEDDEPPVPDTPRSRSPLSTKQKAEHSRTPEVAVPLRRSATPVDLLSTPPLREASQGQRTPSPLQQLLPPDHAEAQSEDELAGFTADARQCSVLSEVSRVRRGPVDPRAGILNCRFHGVAEATRKIDLPSRVLGWTAPLDILSKALGAAEIERQVISIKGQWIDQHNKDNQFGIFLHKWQPYSPSVPGGCGVAIRDVRFQVKQLTYGVTRPLPVFREMDDSKQYSYLGHYRYKSSLPLSSKEWQELPLATQDILLRPLLSSREGKYARAIVAFHRLHNQYPHPPMSILQRPDSNSVINVAKEMTRLYKMQSSKTKNTDKQVHAKGSEIKNALNAGYFFYPTNALSCAYYDEDFAATLRFACDKVAKEAHTATSVAPASINRKRARSDEGNIGNGPSKRLRSKSSKRNLKLRERSSTMETDSDTELESD